MHFSRNGRTLGINPHIPITTTANNRFRIEITGNPTELNGLLTDIQAKREELGTSSPLGGLKWA